MYSLITYRKYCISLNCSLDNNYCVPMCRFTGMVWLYLQCVKHYRTHIPTATRVDKNWITFKYLQKHNYIIYYIYEL